jgi:hypothetical protein
MIELWCLVEGDQSTFPLKMASDAFIGAVKELVYLKGIDTTKHHILAKNLQLLKVSDMEYSSTPFPKI